MVFSLRQGQQARAVGSHKALAREGPVGTWPPRPEPPPLLPEPEAAACCGTGQDGACYWGQKGRTRAQ